MKTISDLQDELSMQYGKLINSLDSSELNQVMAFILTTFADDFPLLKSFAYKMDKLETSANGSYKLYVNNIDEDLLELKMMLPLKNKMSVLYNYMTQDEMYDGFIELEEVFAIQLASDYVNSMSSFYTPKKPMVITDTTGGYVMLNKDVVIMALCERVVDPYDISDSIFAVLRSYASYKFIDFIINRNFGDMLEMNRKVFELMYSNAETDMTNGGGDSIASVSLGGLSVSFNNKLESYATALSGLTNSSTNPVFMKEMNDIRSKNLKAFKRKKNVFYNYMF